ncbi:MAG: hypothetical protein RsTaC01_0876 [Candidatus Paraimprobicoccus trichonymphae]|uniref:Uncharacterized protein n=1 Tax=Candidatus Paraimprobicoccus trichonymphae TaxID=3033793 RepID=A0AA48IA83_9FIRM|nr:MAG: hypothetical protein RsTaC01_0876 [Candidatus Paraimprobicoccus trichonymphae]
MEVIVTKKLNDNDIKNVSGGNLIGTAIDYIRGYGEEELKKIGITCSYEIIYSNMYYWTMKSGGYDLIPFGAVKVAVNLHKNGNKVTNIMSFSRGCPFGVDDATINYTTPEGINKSVEYRG